MLKHSTCVLEGRIVPSFIIYVYVGFSSHEREFVTGFEGPIALDLLK